MANKPGEANFFPDVPVYPEMGTFQPVYGKFDLTTYIQGASDYEIMAFLVGKYNACLEAYGTVTKLSTDTITACKQLQDWINSWFTNLDVQEEINKKLDSMVADGSFGELLHQTFDTQINQQTTNAVTAWLVANVTPTGSAVVVDKSLSIEGAAADAKITGDELKAKQPNLDVLNVTDYGVKPNSSDCTDALIALIGEKTSIALFFPSGNYIFKKHNTSITLPNNTYLYGEYGSNISFDDDEEAGAALFSGASTTLSINSLTFTGRLQTYNSVTNSSSFFVNPTCQNVIFNNVRVLWHRGFAFISSNSNTIKITNCTAYMCCRDVFRFKNTNYSYVYNCTFNRCADDIISFHNDDVNPTQFHEFAYNILKGCGGCGYLGCSNVYIHDNKFENFKGLVKTGTGGSEGVASVNINFYNNTCRQFLHTRDVTTGRVVTAFNDTTYLYIHDNYITHTFTNNNYTNFITYNGYISSVMTDNGCSFNADAENNNSNYYFIYNNYINLHAGPSNVNLGGTHFFYSMPANSVINNNTFLNFYSPIIARPFNNNIVLNNNSFNGNADNLLNNFTAGGSLFDTENDLLPINGTAINAHGNILMNVSSNKNFPGDNIVRARFYADPVVGVNFIADNGNTVESWNYAGKIYNTIPIKWSIARPTSGWYYKGYTVKCSDTSSGVYGWVRLTTSNTHTDSDWKTLNFS